MSARLATAAASGGLVTQHPRRAHSATDTSTLPLPVGGRRGGGRGRLGPRGPRWSDRTPSSRRARVKSSSTAGSGGRPRRRSLAQGVGCCPGVLESYFELVPAARPAGFAQFVRDVGTSWRWRSEGQLEASEHAFKVSARRRSRPLTGGSGTRRVQVHGRQPGNLGTDGLDGAQGPPVRAQTRKPTRKARPGGRCPAQGDQLQGGVGGTSECGHDHGPDHPGRVDADGGDHEPGVEVRGPHGETGAHGHDADPGGPRRPGAA